jgi:hypothetical protein
MNMKEVGAMVRSKAITKRAIAVLAAVICAAAFRPTVLLADRDIKVVYNGTKVSFKDVPPMIENGRVLVPVRVIAELMGSSVNWIEERRLVEISDGNAGIWIRMVVGQDTAMVNLEKVSIDSPAKIVNNRTLVPLRFVSEGLNSEVRWEDSTDTVYINTVPKGESIIAIP